MTQRNFLTIVAAISAVFGLWLLIAPASLMAPYGMALDATAVWVARFGGAALAGMAVTFWYARDAVENVAASPALKGVMYGGCIFNLISLAISLWAVLGGAINPLGWIDIVLHAVLAAGFIYFAEMRQRAMA